MKEEFLPHRSPGEFSNISGTTAISSLSVAEADELDPDMIVDNIADLHREAEKFLRLMAPDQAPSRDFQNIVKDLRIPVSKTSERFRFLEDTFGKYLELFRTAPHDFIRPRVVRHSLFGAHQNRGPLTGKLDTVIYKANLAVLAKQVITLERGQNPAWTALRELDSTFPLLFLSSFSDPGTRSENTEAGASALLNDTLNLALEIRTQLALLSLSRAQDKSTYDPDKELEQVFFTTRRGSSASNDDQDALHVRGWDIIGLGGDGAELPFKDDVVSRVNEIRLFFAQGTDSVQAGDRVDFDALGAEYSWDTFIVQVLNWVRLRNREIQSSIKSFESIDDLCDFLRDEINSMSADRASLGLATRGTPQVQKTSTGSGQRGSEWKRSRSSFDPKKSLRPEAIRFLGIRLKHPTGQAPSKIPIKIEVQREEPREQTHNDEDDTWQPAPNDDDDYGEERREETPAASAPSSSARTLSRIRRQEKNEPENRRRFIDPQPKPERVEWQDGFDQSQGVQRTKRKSKSSQGVSKRRLEVEEESSEDGEFEQGTSKQRRQVPKAKRARFAATSVAPPSYQPRATQQDKDYSPSVRDSTSAEAVARAPSSSAPQYTQYSEVKALARKDVSQRAKLNQARRARNPWSVEACQALIDYIGDIGCSWKDIKRHDEAAGHKLLDDRTQVDLKDKARNLKVEFLKAGCGLPPGFEEVSLGPRIENQLRGRGVKI